MSTSDRRLYGVALAVLVAALLAHVAAFNFVGDDAYITFRYAANLAHHGQLVFNLGERVEGYTNFLWAVLLAGFLRLGVEPAVSSRALGALCGVGALLLSYAIVRRYRGGAPSPCDLVAPALCALTPSFACWCSGGLETPLFALLVLLGLWLYLGDRPAGAGLALAGAAMTRPEGMMVLALVAAHLAGRHALALARNRRIPPALARDGLLLVAFGIPFGAYFAWRWHYYGWPFPNTYYVKAETGVARMLPWGGRYLLTFAIDSPVLALAPLLGIAAAARPGTTALPPRRFFSLLYLLLVPYVAYVASVGGDFMALHRFLAPLVPLAAILAGEGIRSLGHTRLARPALATGLAGAVALIVTAFCARRADASALAESWPRGDTLHVGVDPIGYLARFARDRVVMGTWLRDHMPHDASIVVGAAGALPYESRLYTIDGLGLSDLAVAHGKGPTGDRPGHQKSATMDYILSRRPTLICYEAGAYLGPADLSRTPPEDPRSWRRRGYAWGCLHPEGVPLHYCCWHRVDVPSGPFTPEVEP